MAALFYCSEPRPPTFSKLTRNWRSRTFAICLVIRCFPATFHRVNCQTLYSWGMFWPQEHSWRTGKHCRWGCSENWQLFYVSRSTLGLLRHPAVKIIYNLAISYSKTKQCKNHKITISAVNYAQNSISAVMTATVQTGIEVHSILKPKILLVTSIWIIVSKWIYIAIRSKSICIVWNRLKKSFYQHS